VREGCQGGCRAAAGEEEWGGCRARMAWRQAGGWARGLHDVPGGAARGPGPAYSVALRDVDVQ